MTAIIFATFAAFAAAQDVTKKDHQFTNALSKETSPYLLMHAHNPVKWYGWGEEALTLAKSSGKPIFLSIGYSSCHWCHVMERESFLDEEIAEFLNQNFVCIKVDREERPDVDSIYMESLRVVNPRANGGWPLSMFLTPDAKPFFGGTYFPARDGDRGARFGFLTILKRVHGTWIKKPDSIRKDAQYVSQQVKTRLSGQTISTDAALDPNWVNRCLKMLSESYDPQHGGFGFSSNTPDRPKFPEPSNLLFMLQQVSKNPTDSKSKDQLITTCERMMMGGIYDHLGGGFHRYSVDREWKIPHFEKMLYDNAQLTSVYSRLYELTERDDFKSVVEQMADFVLKEMTNEEGGFYSALDAESEGVEGKFYRWTRKELEELLSADEFQTFSEIYGINKRPNFESEYYVPQLAESLQSIATRKSIETKKLVDQLEAIRNKLLQQRAKRSRPLTDTKILASWNGMMIRGLADAGRILARKDYLAAARKAARFIREKMVNDEGRLVRTYTDGQAKLNAYVTDYACVIDGLIALHEATAEFEWLEMAKKLQSVQNKFFLDEKNGGYFYTSSDHEVLLARAKRMVDSVVPSGNSIAISNLLYLQGQLKDGDREYYELAKKTMLAASPLIERLPTYAPRMLISMDALTAD